MINRRWPYIGPLERTVVCSNLSIFGCNFFAELRKSLMLLQWYYLLPYFFILAASTLFYFIAGSVDPGFVVSDTDSVIMVAYEVHILFLRSFVRFSK